MLTRISACRLSASRTTLRVPSTITRRYSSAFSMDSTTFVRDAQRDVGSEIAAIARGEIVDHDDEVSARVERVDDVATNESRAAGHQHSQGRVAPSSMWTRWWRSSWMECLP